jgi:hypothetical protein
MLISWLSQRQRAAGVATLRRGFVGGVTRSQLSALALRPSQGDDDDALAPAIDAMDEVFATCTMRGHRLSRANQGAPP